MAPIQAGIAPPLQVNSVISSAPNGPAAGEPSILLRPRFAGAFFMPRQGMPRQAHRFAAVGHRPLPRGLLICAEALSLTTRQQCLMPVRADQGVDAGSLHPSAEIFSRLAVSGWS